GVGQRQPLESGQLRQLGQAVVVERRVRETDVTQLGQARQRLQSCPFDERVTEIERSQARERRERVERRVIEQGVTEIETAQRANRRQVQGAQTADFSVAKAERFELRQLLQQRDFSIGDRRRVECDGHRVSIELLHAPANRLQPGRNRPLALSL